MKTQEHTKWKHPPAARDGPLREWVRHKLRDVDIGFEKARFMQGASALPRAPAHCLAFVAARQCIGVVRQKSGMMELPRMAFSARIEVCIDVWNNIKCELW